MKYCVIIPTYNNQNTLEKVLVDVLEQTPNVIVVNDGSTDSTASILEKFQTRITLINHATNQGKGTALKTGFKEAFRQGYAYAITIDSDGQHLAHDIPNVVAAIDPKRPTVVIGARNMTKEGVPKKSSFGNKFSNFWFFAETGISMPDTQTGFRAYPLAPINKLKLFSTKFELEIEIIVRLAWKNIHFVATPIDVIYDPETRVSHFRPFKDFFRISILNTILFTLALLFFLPKRFIFLLFQKKTWVKIKDECLATNYSKQQKALSIGFGLFMGVFPIWGFQMIVAGIVAHAFKWNKFLVLAFSNISIAPLVPAILYLSFLLGLPFMPEEGTVVPDFDLTLDAISTNLKQYLIGSLLLSALLGISGYTVARIYFILRGK